ncbi:MAG: tRNA (adenosine(37)-N6)-dimethylallyltransferase MiaA, partial [Candidatus Eremiobacteraeota bacterium]|nr:tRNA (adenosine(37)-N6)-dimethylallyltransferase MiaA [Candidatus Eremiobacteraeota bacterium]
RGKLPIVSGGTGFYIRALSGDVELAGARDESLRARLAREALVHSPDVMHAWLAALDPARAGSLRPADRYRVARALEIALASRSEPPRRDLSSATLRTEGIGFVKVYLDLPFGELETRISSRVDRMLAGGLLEEAEHVGSSAVAADAVGYPQALAYLRGFSTREELRMQLYRATRRYAKRQITWFRSEPALVHVAAGAAFDQVAALIRANRWA